jgi:hypothetical protein
MVESPGQVSTMRIPPEYANLALAFSKKKATQLPPHRLGDCAIGLLVDAALPRSHVYPLSQAETEAMKTYVSESLRQGYIRSTTSPVSSSFIFVKKMEGGLRPCDYRGLNQITVRYSYLLPLIATAIESMHGARFFTKLDLRSAYTHYTVLKEFPYMLSTGWLLFLHSGVQLIPNHLNWVEVGLLWKPGHLMQHFITLLLGKIALTQPGVVLGHCPVEK